MHVSCDFQHPFKCGAFTLLQLGKHSDNIRGVVNCSRVETDSSHFAAATIYLKSQQAAVDLSGFNQGAAVIAADVCAALIASQVDQ